MDPDVPPATTLYRGGMTLDMVHYLAVRPDGQVVKLTRQECRVLYVLMQHPNRLVTTDQLLAHVWHGAAAQWSNVVAVYIRKLRVKLESDPTHPQHIRTIGRSAYRFVAEELDCEPQQCS